MGLLSLLGGAVVAGVGALLAFVGLGYVSTYARMKRADPVDVRQLDDQSGVVELTGTARRHEATDSSPFTDTESLVHRWRVVRRNPDQSGPEGPKWSTVDTGTETHPFLLDDGAGTVLVDPEGASLELRTRESIEVDGGESPPAAVTDYVETTEDVGRVDERRRRFYEDRIEPGDAVHVLGPVRETDTPVDQPDDVAAVVGVKDPGERGFTVGEDGLSDLAEQIRADTDRYVISDAGESGAQRHHLILKDISI